jgi:hypothetical protein
MRTWNFLPEKLLASQEELWAMELVSNYSLQIKNKLIFVPQIFAIKKGINK